MVYEHECQQMMEVAIDKASGIRGCCCTPGVLSHVYMLTAGLQHAYLLSHSSHEWLRVQEPLQQNGARMTVVHQAADAPSEPA